MPRTTSWRICARCSRLTSSSRVTRPRSKARPVPKTLRSAAGFFFVHRLLFFVALVWGSAAFAADPAYLAELVARSRELKLAERPEWRKLGHYEPDLIGLGVHGLLDSPGFYQSPAGKRDPRAELEATLAAFFSDTPQAKEKEHPQCAFIARRAWLDEALGFD